MRPIVPMVLASLLGGLLPRAAPAQRPHEKWRGKDAQRCAVENCSSPAPSPPAPSHDSGSAARDEEYDRIRKDAVRVWNAATDHASPHAKLAAYHHALELFRRQQAIRDGPKVRAAIAQVEALLLWTSGVIEDERKNHWDAVGKLLAAYKSQPDLFSEGNYNFIAAVNMRHLATLTPVKVEDMTVLVPDRVLKDAIGGRVFFHSPPGVQDRVRKAFHAVLAKDWKVAKAWFQDALRLEPDNASLKSFIALVELPEHKPSEGKPSGADMLGEPLPQRMTLKTLHQRASFMSNPQILKALDDILEQQLFDDALRVTPRPRPSK